MGKLSSYLRLMRPINCLMMGFAVLVGAALSGPYGLDILWQNLIWGFVTGFTLTASSMIINDYYDRRIDAVNEPNRPIPSGLVKPKEAMVFGLFLMAIGLAAAYLTSIFSLALAVVAWLVFLAYTIAGKRSGLPGNFLVSMCVAIPFIYGNVGVTHAVGLNVLVFACIAFLSNTGREVTKGIVDVEGDKSQSVQTVAVRYGEKIAVTIAAIFYLVAVSLTPIPWFLNLVSFWFIPFVIATDIGLVASSFLLLKDHSRENARKIKNLVLLWFIFGLSAYAAGTVG